MTTITEYQDPGTLYEVLDTMYLAPDTCYRLFVLAICRFPVVLYYARHCQVLLCFAMLRYVSLCVTVFRYAVLRYAMLCHVMLCHVLLCDVLPQLAGDR